MKFRVTVTFTYDIPDEQLEETNSVECAKVNEDVLNGQYRHIIDIMEYSNKDVNIRIDPVE